MKYRVFSWIGWTASVLLTLGFLALAIEAVVNHRDTPLDPVVEGILAAPVEATSEETKGFYYLVGIGSGETKEPEKIGQKVYETYLSLPEKERRPYWEKTVRVPYPFDNSFQGCEHEGQNVCLFKDAQSKPDLLKELDREPELFQRYLRLIEHDGLARLSIPVNSGLQFFSLGSHRKFYLHLSKLVLQNKTDEAMELLKAANHMAQGLLKTGTLLDRMVGLVELRSNAAYLQSLLEAKPHLKIDTKLVVSFETPNAKTIWHGAVRSELRAIASLLKESPTSLVAVTMSDFPSWLAEIIGRLPADFFIRPNQSLNIYFVATADPGSVDCAAGKPCTSRELIEMGSPLANPLGKSILKAATENLGQRYKKIEEHRDFIEKERLNFAMHAA